MNEDDNVKESLKLTVSHAVQRMEVLKESKDRRSVFQEYKEWLRESIDDDVFVMPLLKIDYDIKEF